MALPNGFAGMPDDKALAERLNYIRSAPEFFVVTDIGGVQDSVGRVRAVAEQKCERDAEEAAQRARSKQLEEKRLKEDQEALGLALPLPPADADADAPAQHDEDPEPPIFASIGFRPPQVCLGSRLGISVLFDAFRACAQGGKSSAASACEATARHSTARCHMCRPGTRPCGAQHAPHARYGPGHTHMQLGCAVWTGLPGAAAQAFLAPPLLDLSVLDLPVSDPDDPHDARRLLNHLLLTRQLLGGFCAPSEAVLRLLWKGMCSAPSPEPFYAELLRYYQQQAAPGAGGRMRARHASCAWACVPLGGGWSLHAHGAGLGHVLHAEVMH